MSRSALIAITMARKPLAEGSVAENAIRYGTGAIHVEATRIPATDGYQKAWDKPVSTNIGTGTYIHGAVSVKDLSAYRPSGRWPANMVIQHTPSCLPDACDPSCAVADVDAQDPDNRPGSTFFLNLPSDDTSAMPVELIDYLRRMVTVDGGQCITVPDLDGVDLSGLPSDHHHAAIVRGEPTPAQAADLLRTLRPGGHLFAAAPERRPTGHVGACRIEDAGFEIRDCILWVRDAGHVHYVAKASTSEREVEALAT
jgi:hypothetical protein